MDTAYVCLEAILTANRSTITVTNGTGSSRSYIVQTANTWWQVGLQPTWQNTTAAGSMEIKRATHARPRRFGLWQEPCRKRTSLSQETRCFFNVFYRMEPFGAFRMLAKHHDSCSLFWTETSFSFTHEKNKWYRRMCV